MLLTLPKYKAITTCIRETTKMLNNLEVRKQKDNYHFHHIAHRTPDHPAKPHPSLLKIQNKVTTLIHNLIMYAMHVNSISFIQTTP